MSAYAKTTKSMLKGCLPGVLIALLLIALQVLARSLAIPLFAVDLFSTPLTLPQWVVDLDTTFWDLAHWTMAAFLLLYAGFRIQKISAENHAARDERTGRPKALLTSGVYGKVRHPMYGMFMLNIVALLGGLGTLLGSGIALLLAGFQFMNGILEEKRELVPLFGTAYGAYRRAVPAKYFTTLDMNLLLVYSCLTVLDMIF